MKGMLLVLALAVVGVAYGQEPVKFKVVDMPPEFSSITQPRVISLQNDAVWKNYWIRFVTAKVSDANGHWSPMPVVPVDFKTNQVVAIHLGTYADAGYKFDVASVVSSSTGYTINLKQEAPKMVMHHQSHPALLVLIPQGSGKVMVMLNGQQVADSAYLPNGVKIPQHKGFIGAKDGGG